MPFTNKIVNTDHYTTLSPVQKNIALKRATKLQIEHGYHVSKNLGLEQWERQTPFNNIVTGIVRELITKNL